MRLGGVLEGGKWGLRRGGVGVSRGRGGVVFDGLQNLREGRLRSGPGALGVCPF